MAYYRSTRLLCAFLLSVSVSGQFIPNVGKDCKWEMTLKTGDLTAADTRANINLVIHLELDACETPRLSPLSDFKVNDLKKYGTNEDPNHAYFGARNQVDTFAFNGPCWDACRVSILSDGTGRSPGWFLASATRTITSNVPGVTAFQKKATVNTWLSVLDPPYTLNMTINFCRQTVTVTPGNA